MTRLKKHLQNIPVNKPAPATVIRIRQNKLGQYLLKQGNKTVIAGPFESDNEALTHMLVLAIRGK